MKKVLTIAGSDCSGGAGIQADIKTIAAHGIYAMSCITALTAQNTCGVSGIMEVSPQFVGEQLDRIFEDIFPDAVKIGMVFNEGIIEAIENRMKKYKALNIVLDPVMVATSGSKLISDSGAQALTEKLFPLATVITPNIPEAEVLTGMVITDKEHMENAAKYLEDKYKCAVLVKGGHLVNDAKDVLCQNGVCTWFEAERISTENTHGTGCTLSSAIACGLAQGLSLSDSIESAKKYLSGALKDGMNLGKGNGPLNHMFKINK